MREFYIGKFAFLFLNRRVVLNYVTLKWTIGQIEIRIDLVSNNHPLSLVLFLSNLHQPVFWVVCLQMHIQRYICFTSFLTENGDFSQNVTLHKTEGIVQSTSSIFKEMLIITLCRLNGKQVSTYNFQRPVGCSARERYQRQKVFSSEYRRWPWAP